MEYQSDRSLAELAAFASVIEHGGFSAAARAVGVRKATLSDRVRSLELRLGVLLLVRTTRTLRLTDEGRAYLEHARRSLAAAREAETAALASRTIAAGTLRVSMSPALSVALLHDVIAPYMRAYPNVTVHVDASTRVVDLAREGYDLAVRVGSLPDSSLTMRRLGFARGGYFASRAYLARRGAPRDPDDLVHHDTIAMPRGNTLPAWHFVSGARKRSVVIRPRLFVASFELGIIAALAGAGIVPCTRHAVRSHLARKRLVPVLASWTQPMFEVNALFPASPSLAPKTRILVDMLAAWFATHGGKV